MKAKSIFLLFFLLGQGAFVKDFQRMFIVVSLGGGVTTYLYLFHWEKYFPLFGFAILFLCSGLVLIGWGLIFMFLFGSKKNNQLKVFAFLKKVAFCGILHLIAFPLFWFSEPLIYKSIVTTINERVVPDWYYDFFGRDKPNLEEIILEKRNIW